MLFKLELSVRELTLPHGYKHMFTYDGPHYVRVELRAPTPEEKKQGHRSTNAMCTATSNRDVNDANLELFKRIETDTLLRADGPRERTRLEYTLPDGRRTHVPDISELPQFFQSYLSTVSDELNDAAKRTALALRWRLNAAGPHQPFSSRGLSWSWCGDFWHPAPPGIRVEIQAFPPVRITPEVEQQVADFVRSGLSEPLHHTLFREAWEQRRMNPRSAILIGVAAAEVAIKYCISTLVPNSQWLATNLPSPPITRILTDYVPTLPARQTFNGQVKAPPRAMLKSLKKGVAVRNAIIHAGAATPDASSVDEILVSARDVLWMLDYYCGAPWAASYISDSTRKALRSSAQTKAPVSPAVAPSSQQ
jgi:hypothetical protein